MSIEQARAIIADPTRNYESERKEAGLWAPVRQPEGTWMQVKGIRGQSTTQFVIDDGEDQWSR